VSDSICRRLAVHHPQLTLGRRLCTPCPQSAKASLSSRQPETNHGMILLGLTGSIGMGKSTVSLVLTAMGVPVLDSDAVVHRLYASGGAAVCPVADAFGSGVVTPEGSISRPALSALVLGDDGAMARLEAIVHPLVDAARWEFLARAEAASQPLVVLDVPLLYEKGYERTVDAVVVVSTGDAAMQRRRWGRRAPHLTSLLMSRVLVFCVEFAAVATTAVTPHLTPLLLPMEHAHDEKVCTRASAGPFVMGVGSAGNDGREV